MKLWMLDPNLVAPFSRPFLTPKHPCIPCGHEQDQAAATHDTKLNAPPAVPINADPKQAEGG